MTNFDKVLICVIVTIWIVLFLIAHIEIQRTKQLRYIVPQEIIIDPNSGMAKIIIHMPCEIYIKEYKNEREKNKRNIEKIY